jgi:hypothetical protein
MLNGVAFVMFGIVAYLAIAIAEKVASRYLRLSRNYNSNMAAPDKDADQLLLVVPTGDGTGYCTVEFGYWDHQERRWTGEWRYTELADGVPTAQSTRDPIGWAKVPEIDI